MGLQLGRDGKIRAVQINVGVSVTPIGTLYVGLLSDLPGGYNTFTLLEAVSTVGTEFTPSANWYTGGRQSISIEDPPSYIGGAGAHALNDSAVQWTNTTGSPIDIKGVFITDAQSGTTGQVLWIGPPDVGTMTVADGAPVDIFVGGLLCGID